MYIYIYTYIYACFQRLKQKSIGIILLKAKVTWMTISMEFYLFKVTFKIFVDFKGVRHLISLNKFWKPTYPDTEIQGIKSVILIS